MGGVGWTNFILAILIIIFAAIETTSFSWIIIILAVIMVILSLFGVCSCSTKPTPKAMPRAAPKRKKAKRRKR